MSSICTIAYRPASLEHVVSHVLPDIVAKCPQTQAPWALIGMKKDLRTNARTQKRKARNVNIVERVPRHTLHITTLRTIANTQDLPGFETTDKHIFEERLVSSLRVFLALGGCQ